MKQYAVPFDPSPVALLIDHGAIKKLTEFCIIYVHLTEYYLPREQLMI